MSINQTINHKINKYKIINHNLKKFNKCKKYTIALKHQLNIHNILNKVNNLKIIQM